jgi:hypothetical protein
VVGRGLPDIRRLLDCAEGIGSEVMVKEVGGGRGGQGVGVVAG